MTDVAYIPAESVVRERQPAIGYALALGAGTLFAINGTVSKVILESGISSLRLTQVRTTGALIGLAVIILLTRPGDLRTNRCELHYLAAFGVFGDQEPPLAKMGRTAYWRLGELAIPWQYWAMRTAVGLWPFMHRGEH